MHRFENDNPSCTVSDLLGSERELVTARRHERISEVGERLRAHGISQMPVLDSDGQPAGMVGEQDLLRALAQDGARGSDPITPFVVPLGATISLDADIAQLLALFAQDHGAVLVRDGAAVVDIITKIDVLNWLNRFHAGV